MYALQHLTPSEKEHLRVIDFYETIDHRTMDQAYLEFEEDWFQELAEQLEKHHNDSELRLACLNSDIEALSTAGFERPLFFYDVATRDHLGFLDNPVKGGFSCMT